MILRVSEQSFRVDLRGIVDLLSHHLYSSPRVYLRELLQNSVDALTARRLLHEDMVGRVLVVPADLAADGRVHCLDTGVGLTVDEVQRFLATIGSSSKRDELGFARSDFLGQFGIGLLSCFLISDEITVLSRSARGGPMVRWRGSADGSYQVQELDQQQAEAALADLPAVATGAGIGWLVEEPGTWVALNPLPEMQDWVNGRQVRALAAEYGRMLAWDVSVATAADGWQRISVPVRPWDRPGEPAAAVPELEALVGARALATLPVTVPEAGLRGAAVVLAEPTTPTARQSHRVYVKGMLVGGDLEGLLPDWAFFVRCVVDADQLRLTASREGLYSDDLLERVRVSLGGQVRQWLLRTAEVNPTVFERFLAVHMLGVKAMATVDDELLKAVLPWLRFETTAGSLTLPEIVVRFGVVRYATTVDEFRQIAPVAAAQGIGVVNGGYTYDAALIGRLPLVDEAARIEVLLPGDLNTHMASPTQAEMLAMRPFLTAAREVLGALDVDVQLRSFEPAALAALVLDDREARYRRNSRAVVESAAGSAWVAMSAMVDDGGSDRRALLINHRNDTVQQVAAIADPGLLRLALESLYCQALLVGQHPMQAADSAALNRSFRGLIERAVNS
jgi:molecular chaperone HtpG